MKLTHLQPRPRLVRTTMALAVLAAFSGAHAQQAAPESTTIVVTGFRASLESALNKKREDSGIVDVIKAEDIGKFPDTNLAESLQRIPGVVIDRDAGEGRNITVRGLGSDFTRVRLNGMEALATTGGTDSSGAANRGRGFDFNVFASELFNSITVRKSASADVEEGSLGATVDLQSARPFDFKGFTATVSAKGRYNDLSESTDPRAAFLISNVSEDKKFGVLVSGAFSKRSLYEEGFSSVRWDNGGSNEGWCAPMGVTPANPATSTATTCGPAAQGVARLPASQAATDAYNLAKSNANFHPTIPRYGRLTHEQDRLGLTAAVQWKPIPGGMLTFEMLYSKLDATRQEDFLEAMSFSRALSNGGKPQVSVVETAYDSTGNLLYGKYNGVDVRAEQRFDELSTVFTQPTLTWEQDIGDSWRVTARAGRAKSKFSNPVQTTTTLDIANVNGYTIDFRNNSRLPLITYPFDASSSAGGLSLISVPAGGTTIANALPSEIRIRPQGVLNTNDALHLDAAWEAIPDRLTIKFGGDYKKYTFDTFEYRRSIDRIYAPPAGTSVASLTTQLTGFGNGLDLPAGSLTSWVIPNLNAIAAAYDIYCNCLKSGPAGGPGDFTLSSITNGNARGQNQSVEEKDTSAFVMADFKTVWFNKPIRGNFGVRYVETTQSGTGYSAAKGGTKVESSSSYVDVLPSFNLAADLTKDVVWRFAAAKVMARPGLSNLNPGGTFATTGTLAIGSGNPDLKPYRATTIDTNVEWYFAKNAFLGLGLFQKDIDTYIQRLRTTMPFNQTGLPLELLPAGWTGNEVFQVTTPINTEGGKLKGYELNYQQPFTFLPGIGKHFGLLLNYTRVSSKINYYTSTTGSGVVVDDLVGLSPKSYNTTLYYDDGKFSARVSGTYRSSYLTLVPGRNNNDVEGKNETFNVDLSMSYKVNDKLDLTLEGVNLTNEANDQFVGSARNSPFVNHVTGREYLVGMRYKF